MAQCRRILPQVLDIKNMSVPTATSARHGAEIENASGGNAADLLIGNENDNFIAGNGGDDTLLGGAGSGARRWRRQRLDRRRYR